MRRKKKLQTSTRKSSGSIQPTSSVIQALDVSPVYSTPCSSRSSTSFGSSMRTVAKFGLPWSGLLSRPLISVAPTMTSATRSERTSALNSL